MGENVSNMLCVDVYIFENGGKTSPSKIIKKIVQIIFVSYPQTCCRTKIKLTLAVTNWKCRRNWFKTAQNGQKGGPGNKVRGNCCSNDCEPYQIVQFCMIRSYSAKLATVSTRPRFLMNFWHFTSEPRRQSGRRQSKLICGATRTRDIF